MNETITYAELREKYSVQPKAQQMKIPLQNYDRKSLMEQYGIAEKDIKRSKEDHEAAVRDWERFDTIAGYLEKQRFYFAKTMNTNPHFYTLRKDWRTDSQFVDTVIYIRQAGYSEWFWGKKYTMFNVNEWKYWTMGSEINLGGSPYTILINRKHIDRAGTLHYDYISKDYDWYFNDSKSLNENASIMEMIGYEKGKRILDIGCGTGLFIDMNQDISIDDYVGIDVSNGMLSELFKKHGYVNAINCAFEDFYSRKKFDYIISLFGTFSYIDTVYLEKVKFYLNEGGKAFIMFYAPGYFPVTYKKADVTVPHKKLDMQYLVGWKTTMFGNYMIAEYTK